MRRLLVSHVFLTAVVFLGTGAQEHSKLDPLVRKMVDLAIVKANQQLDLGHLNFQRIGGKAQVQPHVKIDLRLKPTTCSEETPHRHRPECPFKLKKGPEVRCVVCSPYSARLVSSPFIDCVLRRDEKKRQDLWDYECYHRLSEILLQPSPPAYMEGVSEGEQQGRQVFKGSIFTIVRSIQQQPPDAFFYLKRRFRIRR